MSIPHISTVDLNLLVVLDAVLTEGNATRAAQKLGMTQSGVSHALNRLRERLGDPLVVRGAGGLVPTPRAEALREPIREALDAIDRAIAPTAFDPAGARGEFVLAMPDYGGLLLLPGLLARVAREAPSVDIITLQPPHDAVGALAAGTVDLLIGAAGLEGEGTYSQSLWEDGFVCVLRRGHPALAEPWTVDAYCALRHVLIAPRGVAGGVVDALLEGMGRRRRVVARVPHFLVDVDVVAASDAIVTMPRSIAVEMADRPVVLREPPFAIPGFTIAQFWHERRNADPAHRWLRRSVLGTSTTGTAR